MNNQNDLAFSTGGWSQANIQAFWGDIAADHHLVQFYRNEKIFLQTLEGFVGTGLLNGDSVVVIATASHLDSLRARLKDQGFNLDALMAADRLVTLDTHEQFPHFLVNDWPQEEMFNEYVEEILRRAGREGQRVRVFGELVAVLWAEGNRGATIRLEQLWHKLIHEKYFTLYCAYPREGSPADIDSSLLQICQAHSTLIDGEARPSTEIYYKNPMGSEV